MKKSLYYGAAAAALCAGAYAGTALANAASGVPVPLADISLPTGDWFGGVFQVVAVVVPTVLTAIVGWAANKYLGIKLDQHYSDYIQGLGAEVIRAAQNRLQERVPGTLVIATKSELLTEAVQFFVETEEPKLVAWFGGAAGVSKWLEGWIKVVPASEATTTTGIAAAVPAVPVPVLK